jgi:hypothetical protein
MNSFRYKQMGDIQYTIVAERPNVLPSFMPPIDFHDSEVIEFLRKCPISLIQLIEPEAYYEIKKAMPVKDGYQLQFWYMDIINFIIENIVPKHKVQLFILNKIAEPVELVNKLRKIKDTVKFFHSIDSEVILSGDDIVTSPENFLEKIVLYRGDILTDMPAINPYTNYELMNRIKFNYFDGTRNNYFMYNNAIGNFFVSEYNADYADETRRKDGRASSSDALKSMHSFKRQNSTLQHISEIDRLEKSLINEFKSRGINYNSNLAPLILVAPFHNPDVKGMIPEGLSELVLIEQLQNYISLAYGDKSDKDLSIAASFARLRSEYLDAASYLHASFYFSPCLRLPMQGKSIYKELSFFGIQRRIINEKKLKKVIANFSNSYQKRVLSKESEQFISNRDGQIVAITDLPIEWLLIEGVPLAFTHDICRIPETSLQGITSNYITASARVYTISRDILGKTLVIYGSSDEDFLSIQKFVDAKAVEFKYNTQRCNSIQEVEDAISRVKPEFIIFDCHGGFDKEDKSTYLQIGEEKLTCEIIVSRGITAPLIFLSACGTAPTYGTFKTVGNAFFEAGALSVTTTYLPVKIQSASTLYARILMNLENVSSIDMHKNWLEFISYIIRTSPIHEVYFKLYGHNEEEEVQHSLLNVLNKMLLFHERRTVYTVLDDLISNLNFNDKKHFANHIPEYLFYSVLGRADLILFDSWLNKIPSPSEVLGSQSPPVVTEL